MAQNVVTAGGNQARGIPNFVQFGIKRRRSVFQSAFGVFFAPLPDDEVGIATITFSGVVPGSEIHIYLQDGTELTGVELCDAGQVLTWPVYATGSPNNTVFITIIKRGVRWQKFNYISKVGSSTIYLFPQPDLGYSNPA